MPRWGYAIVLALIAILAGYTLWPSNAATGIAVFPPKIAEPFLVTGDFGEQRVEGGRVTVAGLDRPTEAMALSAFAAGATALRVPPERVVEGVDAQAARAWGVDGSRKLVIGDQERQWGEVDGTAAVWDPRSRRVYLLKAGELRQITQAAARLDAKPLIELQPPAAAPSQPPQAPPSIDWLIVDGVRMARIDGAWRFPGDQRPRASGRVERILGAVRSVQLTSVVGAPASAEAIHDVRLSGLGGIEEHLRILRADGRLWIERAGTPAQDAGDIDWPQLITSLRDDRLLDPLGFGPPDRVTISRGGTEVFHIGKRGTYGEDGQKPWEVRWSGGAEPAAKDAGERIQSALLGLVISSAVQAAEPLWSGSTTIEIAQEYGSPTKVVLAGSQVWASGWSGTVATMPPVLADLRPDAFLDLHPLPVELARVVKLQRTWLAEAQRNETHARAAGGSWARTFPKDATPADPLAVGRLVRSLVRLSARAVHLASPAEKAIPAQAEIAVRVAPIKVNMTGAEDEVELEDTVPQERAWKLSPIASRDQLLPTGQAWLMVDVTGGLAFTIEAADAEALLGDVASSRLFPVATSLIAAVEVGGVSSFRLERRAAAWVIRSAGVERPADAVAARRLLRALTALEARGPAAIPSGESVAIVVETGDGERITARILVLAPDTVLAMTERGGVALDAAAWTQVGLDPAGYAAGPQ